MQNEQIREQNRRSEARFQPCLEEVLWRPEGSTRRALRGCLRDVSDQGLSFVTARLPAPCTGEELYVHMLGTQECAPCRVVWVERGKQLAAIGCRVVRTTPQPAPRQTPAPRLMAAV